MTAVPVVSDVAHRRCLVGKEPMLFHCHHYNVFLQRALQDAASFLSASQLLVGAGAEVAYAQLSNVFREQGISDKAQRKAMAQEIYRWAGFGVVDLEAATEAGGTVRSPNSHYAMGWRVRFGEASAPVCHFASGWIAGALAAIYDAPAGTYEVEHTQCMAVGKHDACVFVAKRGKPSYEVFTSPGTGALTEHHPLPVPANPVDYDGVLKAVSGLPLVGDAQGNIAAFGVYLTRHYANYYNRVSFEYLHRVEQKYGDEGRQAVAAVLQEAGHVCAFHTFGGIMTSTEWDALIRPNLKTKADWIHGIVAVINALGWGRWQVASVAEDAAEFVLHDYYESVGYLACYGKAKAPVSYMSHGVAAGLMGLVFVGDIASRPELSPEFYNELFKKVAAYSTQSSASRAMGAEHTRLLVRHA